MNLEANLCKRKKKQNLTGDAFYIYIPGRCSNENKRILWITLLLTVNTDGNLC